MSLLSSGIFGPSGSTSLVPNTIVLMGDSITYDGHTNGLYTPINGPYTSATDSGQGYWSFADLALSGRIRPIANFGISGQTTTQMLARFASNVLTMNPLPGWVLIAGGQNDATNTIPFATTISNELTMAKMALAAGIKVILTSKCPNNGSTTNAGVGQIGRAYKTFALQTPGVVFVDFYKVLADPVTGRYLTGLSDDGVHPNSAGASRMGAEIYNVLSVVVPPCDQLISSNVDEENLISNGMFTGTGGSQGGATTGTLAANWTSRYTLSTSVFSQVASTDGPNCNWQQVACSAQDGVADMYQTFHVDAGGVYEAMVEYQRVGSWNSVIGWGLHVSDGSTPDADSMATNTGANPFVANTVPAAQGVIRTIPFIALNGTAGANRYLFLTFSGPGTVMWRRASVKRIA